MHDAHTGIKTVKISKLLLYLLYSTDKYFKVYAVYNVLREPTGKFETTELLVVYQFLSSSAKRQENPNKHTHSHTELHHCITQSILPLFHTGVGQGSVKVDF